MSINLLLQTEPENDWANDVKDNPIHISQAESGLKGYYCMGCGKAMQAVKMKNPKHQSYFRHHIKDIDTSKIECVHASKEYREKLAYFYFMRVKQIKVPAVYKYPPKGQEEIPMFLEEAKTIVAHRVERELTFYENEDGEIKWGKNPEIDERYLLIRPDAIFFDKDDKPILFLEFVVTHKPDVDKLNKLQRLGINTVQIIVPKLPEAELEKSISSVSKVKWTYNEIESNAEYLPISSGNTEGIPFIDEEQRKLFEESYKCRRAQLNNLIQSIKRCLASQSYRRIEHLFEQEISRIEKATREHQSRFDEIQAGIESEIHSELRERRQEINDKREKFQKNVDDLEGRYRTKRSSIIEKRRYTDWEIEFRQSSGTTEEGVRRKFESTEREFIVEERAIESETEFIGKEEERIVRSIDEDRAFERDFEGKGDLLAIKFEQLEEEERIRFEGNRERIESENKGFSEFQNQEESGIRSGFEREYEQITERVNNRDIQGGDELSDRIATILEIRRILDSCTTSKEFIGKIEQGLEFIKDGTWKK